MSSLGSMAAKKRWADHRETVGEVTEKQCNCCHQILSLEMFAIDRSNKTNGRQGTCKLCGAARRKIQYTREQERWRHIKRKYNLTQEQWEALFKAQGSCCAICGTTDPGSSYGWHTDHCHETNKVRGILCMGCNRGIGYIKEPEHLEAGAEYLRKHSH